MYKDITRMSRSPCLKQTAEAPASSVAIHRPPRPPLSIARAEGGPQFLQGPCAALLDRPTLHAAGRRRLPIRGCLAHTRRAYRPPRGGASRRQQRAGARRRRRRVPPRRQQQLLGCDGGLPPAHPSACHSWESGRTRSGWDGTLSAAVGSRWLPAAVLWPAVQSRITACPARGIAAPTPNTG